MFKLPTVILASALGFMTINAVQAEQQPSAATGQAPAKHAMQGKMGPMARMFKGINLTVQQQKEIASLLQNERKNLPKSVAEERKTIHDLIISDSLDQAKVDAVAEQRASHEKQMVQSRIMTQNKIYHLLTAEQQKQYNQNYMRFESERKMPHPPRS